MRESKSKEIDGVLFTVQTMPLKRSLRLMHKLARAGMPAMLKAVGGANVSAKVKLADMNIDLSNLSDAAAMVLDKFSENDLEHMTNELLESATITAEGKEAPALRVMDSVCKPMTVFKALGFALEVNYGDFFAAFLDAAGTLQPEPAPVSKA